MQTDPTTYEPFLSVPIRQYCQAYIDPFRKEIEGPGLLALINTVILPAGFAAEVLYLDRSPGDEVTTHSFPPNGNGLPIIMLLYRP